MVLIRDNQGVAWQKVWVLWQVLVGQKVRKNQVKKKVCYEEEARR